MAFNCSYTRTTDMDNNLENWLYDGEFIQGNITGNGTIIYSNDKAPIAVYSGQWQDNKIQGQGNFVYGPSSYQGNWNKNKKHSYGNDIYKNEKIFDSYESYFDKGNRHGFGNQETESYYFSGNWSNDSRLGIGLLISRMENTYIGQFENNQIEGNFINIDPTNKVSFGYFSNGIKKYEISIDQLKNILNCIINSNLVKTLKENNVNLDDQKINIINSVFGGLINQEKNSINFQSNNLDQNELIENLVKFN